MTINDESNIFGISIRAIIACTLTLTVCFMCLKAMEIKEPLYTAFTLILGFFFGQKTQTSTAGNMNIAKVNDVNVAAGPDPKKPDPITEIPK